MKIGDEVVTFKREPLAKKPYVVGFDSRWDRQLDYGRGVFAGVILNGDGTAVAYRQIGAVRNEVPAPDQGTAITVLLVIHHEIKTRMKDLGLTFGAAERELHDIFFSYGPRLSDFTEPRAPEASTLAGYRGEHLKPV